MIDNDDIEAKPSRFRDRLEAGGAAIDGDEQTGAAFGQRADRLDVRAVALEQPIGNMDVGLDPARAQEAREQRRSRRPVDVIVAEDGDALRTHDGVRDADRRVRHRLDHVRIRHQPPDAGIEIRRDLVGLDAAPGENAGKQFRNILALRDGERARRAALIEPVAPGAAAHGTFDVEKQASRRLRGGCQGDRHGRRESDSEDFPILDEARAFRHLVVQGLCRGVGFVDRAQSR